MKRIIAVALTLIMVLGLFSCVTPTGPSTTSTTKSTDNNIIIGNGTGTTTNLPTSTTTSTTTSGNEVDTTTKPNDSTGDSTTTSSTQGTTTSSKDDEPNLDNFDPDELAIFEEFFNPENHVDLYLDISNAELKKIQKDYEAYSSKGSKSPIYRMADLYITITKPNGEEIHLTYEQVGVRMKGNTSRTSFYSDSKGMYNLVHFKISFQETFDDEEYYGSDALTWTNDAARKERKNRTFATLEKIDIRWNKNDDYTYIREHYAYELYREQGVLAPHTTLASVDIGKDHAGVWLVYEPIDKTFLEKNLPESALGGDLYKLGWTSEGATFTKFSSYGIEDEDAGKFYVYDLKTNKKTSDHSALKNLITTLNSSSLTKDKFASVIDIDNFLAYAAVSYIVGNPDDLRNNYNNTYIYFRADTGQVMFIPYDMDRGLGVNKDWNPSGNHMTKDSPFSNTAIGNNSTQKNPLFTKGILSASFYKNEYTEALKLVAESDMLKVSTFTDSFNLAKALYGSEAKTSKTYSNASGHSFSFDINKSNDSNMSFSNYITTKLKTLSNEIGSYVPDDNTGSGDNQGSGTPDTNMDLYLRGNFNNNNWTNQSQYKLTHIGNGVYSVSVTCTSSLFKFKIYNNKTGEWYNKVDESKTTAWFEYQGSNENVQVQSGTYTIYYDSATGMMYLEKK